MPYLLGKLFVIITDYQPLKWLMNVKDPSSRLMRWQMQLEEYEYKIQYKKGKSNLNADTLSRNPVNFVETSKPNWRKHFKFVKQPSDAISIHFEQSEVNDYEVVEDENNKILATIVKITKFDNNNIQNALKYIRDIFISQENNLIHFNGKKLYNLFEGTKKIFSEPYSMIL